MRDEDFLMRLDANPLQVSHKKAISDTLSVIEGEYLNSKKPIPVETLLARLAYAFGFHESRVRRSYLPILEKVGKIAWDRKADTVVPTALQQEIVEGEKNTPA